MSHKPPDPASSKDWSLESKKSTTPLEGFGTTSKHIGPYRILEQIGEGGMGVVYLAEQEHPVRRRAALKIIKLGMDTKEVIARFEAERQALAMMSHPNIAKVFDAGTTEQGRPYFVMEHVPGEPITRYCDRQRLTTKERLELFIPVCQGIHHAHQKAIIHRDVKPSNILVMAQDGKPIPKVIDFGVAKAIEHRLTERTVFTEQGQLIGTPGYMSPEQAEMTGLNVDTTTDVYSLGVLLYELLVGAPPFDPASMREAGLEAIQRMIREVDPPRPSTRVSRLGNKATRVAQNRRSEPAMLERQLRGELDWIIMRAMEKDRNRRYTSAAEFPADVNRSLAHEPVLASPPSQSYRARKFALRHRVAVTAGAMVILALFLGTVSTTVGLLRARQASRKAKQAQSQAMQEAEKAKHVANFLVGVFEVSDPSEALGNTITAREILDKGAKKIEEELADQPEIQATLMSTMGSAYQSLGLYDAAEPLLKSALKIRQRVLTGEHPDVATSLHELGWFFYKKGDLDAAEPFLASALKIRQRVLGDEHPDVATSLDKLGWVLYNKGDYDGAEPLLRDALALKRKLQDDEHSEVASGLNSLAVLFYVKGDYDTAESMFRESLEINRKFLGEEHPDVAGVMNNLAIVLRSKGDYDGAEQLYREALAMKQKLLGEEHPDVALGLNNLANVIRDKGELEAAESLYRKALAMQRKLLDEHPDVAMSLHNLATMLRDAGKYSEAEPLYRESLAMRRKLLAEGHPEIVNSLNGLASLLSSKGDYDGAEPLFREVLAIQRKMVGEEHLDVVSSLKNLAYVLIDKGDLKGGETLFLKSLAIQRKLLGEEHLEVVGSLYDVACLKALQGEQSEALRYLGEAVDRGYNDTDWLMNDSDLESLHGDPKFKVILDKARKIAQKE